MINTRNKILMASALALAVASCGGGGGGKSHKSVYPTPPVSLKQAVSIVVLDAQSGAPITVPVTVSAVGADAPKLEDSNGAGTPWTAAVGGGLVLTTDSTVTDATLVFSAPGYFNNSIPVTLKAGEMVNQTVSLSLKTGAAASGIMGASKDVAAVGGSVGALDVALATPGATVGSPEEAILAGAKVEATIPANTKLLDKDGNAVSDGNVKMDMALFPNDANGAAEPGKSPLKSFPGGVNDVRPAGGTSGYFVSGGLTALELTGPAGEKVTKFEDADGKPAAVTVTTTVPQSTINPNTNAVLVNGDWLPIWSYSESTGEWTEEDADADADADFDGDGNNAGDDGKVENCTSVDGTGTCTVTMKATHLSYWNLDWFYSERCDGTVVVNVRDVDGNRIPDNWVKVEMRRVGGGWSKQTSISGSSLEVLNAPKNVAMDVIFYDASGSAVKTITNQASVCSMHNTTVNMPVVPPEFVQVVPKPQMVCHKPEDREKYKPVSIPAVVYVWDLTSYAFIAYEYRAANSTSALDLIKGNDYMMFAWTLEAVKDKDGKVVLPAYSWAFAGDGMYEWEHTYTATADGNAPMNFYVPCSEVTGTGTGTGGGSDGQ